MLVGQHSIATQHPTQHQTLVQIYFVKEKCANLLMLFLNLYRIIDMINHKSKLVCPHCSHEKTITMPSTFCQYFLECTNCKTVIKAKAGDCCVFCSYGDIKCPPIQKN